MSPHTPKKKKVVKVDFMPIHFGSWYATYTDVTNDLMLLKKKINEIIDFINTLPTKK